MDPSKAGKDFHIWPEDGNRGGEIRELLVRSDFILLRGTTERGKSGRVLVVWAVRLGATPESLGVSKSWYQSC